MGAAVMLAEIARIVTAFEPVFIGIGLGWLLADAVREMRGRRRRGPWG